MLPKARVMGVFSPSKEKGDHITPSTTPNHVSSITKQKLGSTSPLKPNRKNGYH
jgi:hypothetical protein